MTLGLPRLAALKMPRPYKIGKLSIHRMLTPKLAKLQQAGAFRKKGLVKD